MSSVLQNIAGGVLGIGIGVVLVYAYYGWRR